MKRRILFVHSEREKFHGKVVEWKDYEIHFAPYCYEDFIGHPGTSDRDIVLFGSIIKIVMDLADGYDAVWCESPDALLLQFFRDREGRRRVPFVINEEDMLIRVKILCEWMREKYGEDPLGGFLRREENHWLHMTRSQRPFYLEAGVPGDKLYYLACSSYLLNFVAPEQLAVFREVADGAAEGPFAGKIIAGGSNNRDYDTLVRAVEGIGAEVHVICDLSSFKIIDPGEIAWHDFLPVREYIRALKGARFVVVPLIPTGVSGGENTITYAMALGKAVVATRDASTEDFLTDGEDCLLVPPGDPAALRTAIVRLMDDPALAARLGENAKNTEKTLSETCENDVEAAFQKAFSWNAS